MVNFRESNSWSHALQRLAHDGLGGAGLAGVVQPHHQQEDLLVLPHAPDLPALETRTTVASHITISLPNVKHSSRTLEIL